MAFSFWTALGHGVKRVRERPRDALRIWAFDAAALVALPVIVIVMSGAWAGPGNPIAFAALSPLQMVCVIAAFASLAVFWLCSEGAWARFLATDETVAVIPYRLSRDEWRIFALIIFWTFVALVLTFCMMMPIGLFRVLVQEDGAASQAGAVVLMALAGLLLMFVLPRINATAMLAVRRKAFSPLGHFSATDPFWFRLGLAFGVGYVLSLLCGYGIPGFLSVLSGLDADTRMMIAKGSLTPWANWFVAQKQPHIAPFIVLFSAWLGSGFGLLVMRGIAAHAAIHAQEREELDTGPAYPAPSSVG